MKQENNAGGRPGLIGRRDLIAMVGGAAVAWPLAARAQERTPAKKNLTIRVLDDFAELKESEVIEVGRTAKLISKNVSDILRDKLRRRNMAAHPSRVRITQAQVDDVITDLVHNVLAEKTAGKVQNTVGGAKDAIRDAVKKVTVLLCGPASETRPRLLAR